MSKLILDKPLSGKEDIREFDLFGNAEISFPKEALRIETKEGEAVLLSTGSFPSDVRIEWEFKPVECAGRAEVIFAAKNSPGSDNAGGDSVCGNYFRLSYYRRKDDEEKSFHLSKLEKSVAGRTDEVCICPDPLPDEIKDWYKMCVTKNKDIVSFSINGFEVLRFEDDKMKYDELLTGGRIGFVQEAFVTAEYRNLKVTWI
ncbi:MAG: DUF1961 family protein [Butyrivibrio sp.]|nr:DUF1961 family protein [Butyrivibrio sp.]